MPTNSGRYEKQVFFDAFSSDDLVNWEKHATILDTSDVRWAWRRGPLSNLVAVHS